jgi:tetratricopeptide (TPR) repeat protein
LIWEHRRTMPTVAELLNLARERYQAGDFAAADRLYRQVLEAEPACVEALVLLAVTCHQVGDFLQAEAAYRQALAVHPHDAEVHFRMAMVLMSLSRPEEAARHLREAVRLRPESPEPWNNLGNVLFLQGKFPEAVDCYRNAVRLRPSYAEACQNLGNALREDDRVSEGLTWYRESVRLRPDNLKYRMNLAAALLETGGAQEAEDHLREYIRLLPGAPRVLSTLIANDLYSNTDPGPAEIRLRLDDPTLPPLDRAHLHFTLAHLLDRAGHPEDALQHFEETNRIRRDLVRGTPDEFKCAEHSRMVDDLIALFGPEWFERFRGIGVDAEELVFVVGMPRSGSSLVEQILSHHPEVAGAGELRDVPRMVEALPSRLGSAVQYPNCLSAIEPAMIRACAQEYVSRVRELAGPARRITDKMLVNFLHLGLIAILFPKARIIHCRRDPLDTCVSCFVQIFRGLSFTLDLEDLGRYYRDYERLMNHWRVVLPLQMTEIVYEELVADVERGTRQLLDFCELPWDERCLRFYENPRTVRTVSKFQVRRPVYTTSIGRWRRYADRLAPLLQTLGVEGTPANVP